MIDGWRGQWNIILFREITAPCGWLAWSRAFLTTNIPEADGTLGISVYHDTYAMGEFSNCLSSLILSLLDALKTSWTSAGLYSVTNHLVMSLRTFECGGRHTVNPMPLWMDKNKNTTAISLPFGFLMILHCFAPDCSCFSFIEFIEGRDCKSIWPP